MFSLCVRTQAERRDAEVAGRQNDERMRMEVIVMNQEEFRRPTLKPIPYNSLLLLCLQFVG